MEIIEANPLPEVCINCAERKECTARGEGEWCCDECDYLGERFIVVLPEYKEKEGVRYDN